jgi:DNA-binding CsgD family transcriptional regulator
MDNQCSNSLINLRKGDELYNRVLALSENAFEKDEIGDMSNFVQEAEFILQGVKGTDAVIGIFNHNNYAPVLEVGSEDFWGAFPKVPLEERMHQILGLLEKEYSSFPAESVSWFAKALEEIPLSQKTNFKFFHCGIRYRRLDGKAICLFSKGLPIHYDAQRNFTFTFNYVQNVAHLLKKDFCYYWVRISHGLNNEFVHSFHSENKEYSNRDLLSPREKEILLLIADDLDTREIAEKLFISPNTVGNHRSNMIDRLGARDTTALVQLAKMTEMI